MSINLKKIMVTGAALLMFASVAAPSANVSVSARHVRTHRVRRHSRRALRHYRHGKNVHKYNSHKIAHRHHLRHYRSRRNAHKRNVHKINVRKYNHKNRKKAKRSSKPAIEASNLQSGPYKGIIKAIHNAKQMAPTLNFPSEFFGNYFNRDRHNYDYFLHLARHGSYALANGMAAENYGKNFHPTGSPYVRELDPGQENGGINTMSPKIDFSSGCRYASFDNSVAPNNYKIVNGRPSIVTGKPNGDPVYVPLHRVNSEQQGIQEFEQNNNTHIPSSWYDN